MTLYEVVIVDDYELLAGPTTIMAPDKETAILLMGQKNPFDKLPAPKLQNQGVIKVLVRPFV